MEALARSVTLPTLHSTTAPLCFTSSRHFRLLSLSPQTRLRHSPEKKVAHNIAASTATSPDPVRQTTHDVITRSPVLWPPSLLGFPFLDEFFFFFFFFNPSLVGFSFLNAFYPPSRLFSSLTKSLPLLLPFFGSVQPSSRWYQCARKSPHALPPPYLRSLPKVAFETVPMFV